MRWVFSGLALLILLLGTVTLSVNIRPGKASGTVGVKAGDWIICAYTISGWPAGTPYPEWLKVEFLSVEGTNATIRVTMHMSDGTEQNDTMTVDVAAGGGTFEGLSGFVIPANCTTGNSIYMSGYGDVTIDGETTGIYAGATRTVVSASFSQYGTQLTYCWDKLTGVMVEASVFSVRGGVTATAEATETNMWQSEIVYIRADGSIYPPGAPISTFDNVTYTLTDNVTSNADGIVVERDKIVVDGAGYTVQGTGSGAGITLSGRSNITIKNTEITTFSFGILFDSSSGNIISGNNITNNWFGITSNMYGWLLGSSSNSIISGNNIIDNTYGIYLGSSPNSIISGNNITNNDGQGIRLDSSSNSIVSGNNITDNGYGIELSSSSGNSISGNTFTNDGLAVWNCYQNSVENNTVNGRPLIYLEGVSNHTVDDAGQVVLVNCENITVEDLNLSKASVGIELWETSNSTISGNEITNNNDGIDLYYSSNYNSISGNNITENNDDGIYLDSSSDTSVSGNNITNNGFGMRGFYSSSSIISGNNITENNDDGIYLYSSSSSAISGNAFTNDGLVVFDCYQNSVENNTVNGRPLIYLEGVSNHTVDDAGQVILIRCENIRIEGLNLSKTDVGVMLSETSSSIISGNEITNNNDGIDLYYSSNYNSISGNNIAANNWSGILLSSSLNGTISENNITNNNWEGIYLGSSPNSSVSGNNITDNGYGIALGSSSDGRICHNNFVNNRVQVYSSEDSANIWDDGYPSGGNYWSDYNGTDSNHDGIGDTPYIIDANNTDNYPLMSTWTSSNMVGDLNGDGKVSLQDLQLLANAYHSKPGDPNWNPLADLAEPFGRISLTDLVTMAMHYGQHNP